MSGGSELQVMLSCFDLYNYHLDNLMYVIGQRKPGDKAKGWG